MPTAPTPPAFAIVRRTAAPLAAPLAAIAAAALLAACAGTDSAPANGSAPATESASAAITSTPTAPTTPSEVFPIAFSDDILEDYDDHITTLADPEVMAGRLPGTPGIENAARYIIDHFDDLDLEPAFPSISEDDTSIVIGNDRSFRQPFNAGGGTRLLADALAARSPSGAVTVFESGDQYNILGYGGSGFAEGPLAFIGYSIEDGPDGYNSFATASGELDDLTGHIAMLLRFEPHSSDGTSMFADSGWSGAAGLGPKFANAINRGAEGVIMVTPPTVNDPRADRLESVVTTGWGGTIADVPVAHMTPAAADLLLESLRAEVTLADLIDQANDTQTAAASIFNRGTVSIDAELDRSAIVTDNIGAILPGRGDLADEYVVIGAHYDHLGNGPFGSRVGSGRLHPGADDNASGTSGVLITASLLSEHYDDMPADADLRSVLFLLFSAEESGLNGSRYYAQNPIAAVDEHHVMINLDMIGSYGDGQGLEIGALASGDRLAALFTPVLDASGLDTRPDSGVGTGRSDHASFDRVGIPNVFLFTGLTDEYHTPDDTLATIDVVGGAQIATLAANLSLAAATDPMDIAHRDNQPARQALGGPMSIRVRVGIAPGTYSGQDGVLVGQVYDGTSAALGGVEAGDRITVWGGEDVTTVTSWMPMLAAHAPGDEVEITVVRGGEPLDLTLTLQARQSDG